MKQLTKYALTLMVGLGIGGYQGFSRHSKIQEAVLPLLYANSTTDFSMHVEFPLGSPHLVSRRAAVPIYHNMSCGSLDAMLDTIETASKVDPENHKDAILAATTVAVDQYEKETSKIIARRALHELDKKLHVVKTYLSDLLEE